MARYYKHFNDPLGYVADTRTVLVDAVSTGMTLPVAVRSVDTAWQVVAEAPRFSIVDNAERFWPEDSPAALLATDRTLRPGELFFQTPLIACNRGMSSVRVEARLSFPVGSHAPNNWTKLFDVVLPAPVVPGVGDTILLPIQGMHLIRMVGWSYGQRLELKASVAGVLDVSFTCTEQEMPRHYIAREIMEDDAIPLSGAGD